MSRRGSGESGPDRQALLASLQRHPVMATLFGPGSLGPFLDGQCELAIVANVDLARLSPLLALIRRHGKLAFVNIDSCPGLAQDRGGLEFLQAIEAYGVVSTRSAVIQQGAALGLRTVRKVFLTDRSNLPRSSSSVASGGADLVQLMPWPVLAHVGSARLAPFGSFIAGGFVADCDSIEQAMDLGAVGVSTSDTELWDYTRPDC